MPPGTYQRSQARTEQKRSDHRPNQTVIRPSVIVAFDRAGQTPDRHGNPHDAYAEASRQCEGVWFVRAVDCHDSSGNIRRQYIRGVAMAIPWAAIPEGTRVKVKQGVFPLDPALIGRIGVVVVATGYKTEKVGIALDN